ncbi:MAG: hypothetical protein ACH37Z_11425 [Anaerolineae bacterium]
MSKKHKPAEKAPEETPGPSSLPEAPPAAQEGGAWRLGAGPAWALRSAPAQEAPEGVAVTDAPAKGGEAPPEAPAASEGEPSAEELDQLPGGNPPGSVSGKMRNGETLTVPARVADQISDWLDEGPGRRDIASGRVLDRKVVVVSYPDYQKREFLL